MQVKTQKTKQPILNDPNKFGTRMSMTLAPDMERKEGEKDDAAENEHAGHGDRCTDASLGHDDDNGDCQSQHADNSRE
jgi:hypothetical protein